MTKQYFELIKDFIVRHANREPVPVMARQVEEWFLGGMRFRLMETICAVVRKVRLRGRLIRSWAAFTL